MGNIYLTISISVACLALNPSSVFLRRPAVYVTGNLWMVISAILEKAAANNKASIIAPRILLVSILKREVYV